MSHRIDTFDDILCNNLPIWNIINKGSKESELSPSQVVRTLHKICFLKQAYLAVLNLETTEKIHFEQCCETAIEDCQKFGFKTINSPKVLMKLNRYFRRNETLPHPNMTIELGHKYHLHFLEAFSELEFKL